MDKALRRIGSVNEPQCPRPAERFFRIIKHPEPRRSDFVSNYDKGLPTRQLDAESLRLWKGISTYGTLRRARERAWDLPNLGEFIAELSVADRWDITVERTTSSRSHYTLWGPSDSLLAAVVAVHPVGQRLIKEDEERTYDF